MVLLFEGPCGEFIGSVRFVAIFFAPVSVFGCYDFSKLSSAKHLSEYVYSRPERHSRCNFFAPEPAVPSFRPTGEHSKYVELGISWRLSVA